MAAFGALAGKDEEGMGEVVEVLRVLNAYDKRRVDVPDYDSRLEGFTRCASLIHLTLISTILMSS